MSYQDLMRESFEFFGSPWSVPRTIWFRKYRQRTSRSYDYSLRKVLIIQTIVALLAIIITLLFLAPIVFALSFLGISVGIDGVVLQMVTILFMCVILFTLVQNVIWPYLYRWMLVSGMVRKK